MDNSTLIEREWRMLEGCECPMCGSVAEVFTESKKYNYVYDEEDARCAECGHTGSVCIYEESADIVWDDIDADGLEGLPD